MGWFGCIRCEKFRHDFVAQTFALIASVQLVLHQVSCSNETISNVTKHCETHQNMGWGSNVLDWVRSKWKITKRIRGTKFGINGPVQPILHWVSCINETIPNTPKHYETHQSMSLGSNGVDKVRWLRKITTWFVARTFALIASVQYVLQQVLMQLRNDPKCT